MNASEARAEKKAQILERRSVFKYFSIFSKKMDSATTITPPKKEKTLLKVSPNTTAKILPKKQSEFVEKYLQPPYITINKRLVLAVYKRKRTKVDTKLSAEENAISEFRFGKYNREMEQDSNKGTVKDINKSAETLKNLPIDALNAQNSHLLQGKTRRTKALPEVPSVFKVELKPMSKISLRRQITHKISESSAEMLPQLILKESSTGNQSIICQQSKPTKSEEIEIIKEQTSSANEFFCEKSYEKVKQFWCKENYNPHSSSETIGNIDDTLFNPLPEFEGLTRTAAGSDLTIQDSLCEKFLPESLKENNSQTEIRSELSKETIKFNGVCDVGVQAEPERHEISTELSKEIIRTEGISDVGVQVEPKRNDISTELSKEIIQRKGISNVGVQVELDNPAKNEALKKYNSLRAHIMKCPIRHCGMEITIRDFLAHIYRAHNTMKRKPVLRGCTLQFEMQIYPKHFFQAAIILFIPSTNGPIDITKPFLPIILTGDYIMDEQNRNFFAVWLMANNDSNHTDCCMEIVPSKYIEKTLRCTIFDIREINNYQEILQSKKALVFTEDEINLLTKHGERPLLVNVTIH